jgi:hypothetical protein
MVFSEDEDGPAPGESGAKSGKRPALKIVK